jgi:transposase
VLRISDIVRGKEISENVSMKNRNMTLTSQEQERIKVLEKHLSGKLSMEQVAAHLQCSLRHAYRLKARYRQVGACGMGHGNRGKRSPRRIAEAVREEICQLVKGVYQGCNQRHVRDLLEERDTISISRASLRRIMNERGLLVITMKKRRTHRLRRPRYKQEGQLIQIDASAHAWLEERGPRLTLVGGIDDATGKVVGAVFREQEDQQGYMLMLRQVVETYGCPGAIYHDRHTMFPGGKSHVDEKGKISEQLDGKRHETQLGRLFTQLGSISIAARSPQAKGRIERLWGTLQNRLVSELRLAGARTLHEANEVLQQYLPRFNARFVVAAAHADSGWQAVSAGLDLDECFCLHDERTVTADNTISYLGQRFQLLPNDVRPHWVRCRVEVHAHFDGQVRLFYQGQALPARPAPADLVALRPSKEIATPKEPTSKAHPPQADHPWRKAGQARLAASAASTQRKDDIFTGP